MTLLVSTFCDYPVLYSVFEYRNVHENKKKRSFVQMLVYLTTKYSSIIQGFKMMTTSTHGRWRFLRWQNTFYSLLSKLYNMNCL